MQQAQMQLDFSAPPVAIERPKSLKEEAPRLNRQCRLLLERLKLGPATNTELVMIAQRFGARIKELRDEGGCEIKTEKIDAKAGLNRYTLVSYPPRLDHAGLDKPIVQREAEEE